MVYFHAVDFVLGREKNRQAYRYKCHLPKVMFAEKVKGRRPSSKSAMKTNFEFFKRMLAVKEAVYSRHKKMFELYEQRCYLLQPGAPMYWGDGDDLDDADEVQEAKDVEEASCAESF